MPVSASIPHPPLYVATTLLKRIAPPLIGVGSLR
jgi:hypothetical protein